MNRAAIFFLMVVTLGLAILLSWLGRITLPTNLFGWFLLVAGLVYLIGISIVYWIRGIKFWRPRASGEVIQEERDEWNYYDDDDPYLKAFRWVRLIPPLAKSSGIFHYRLGSTT